MRHHFGANSSGTPDSTPNIRNSRGHQRCRQRRPRGITGSSGGWGYNAYGQTTVPFAAQSGVVAIAAGGQHILALKSNGAVIAWGGNDYGQTTVPPSANSGVVAMAAGMTHSVAVKSDGSVVAWGRDGETTVPVTAQSGVVAIAAGNDFNLALVARPLLSNARSGAHERILSWPTNASGSPCKVRPD